MPSRALTRLDGRLKDIQDLLDAGEKKAGAGVGRKWNVEALWRSSIVLCTAHLEGFVEDLFSEAAIRVISAKLKASEIPLQLKLIPLRRFADSIRESQSHANRETALSGLLQKAAKLSHPAKRITPRDIPKKDLDALTWNFMSPKSDEIDALFAHLGIKKIIEHVSLPPFNTRKIRNKLKTLLDRRNEIAHGTIGVKVGKQEVVNYRDFLKRLASCLDEIVRTHTVRISGHTWP